MSLGTLYIHYGHQRIHRAFEDYVSKLAKYVRSEQIEILNLAISYNLTPVIPSPAKNLLHST